MTVWLPPSRRHYRYRFFLNGKRYEGNTKSRIRETAEEIEASLQQRVSRGARLLDPRSRRKVINLSILPATPLDADEYARLVLQHAQAVAARSAVTGIVYFIRVGTVGPVKIGFATNFRKRLQGIQTGSPVKLKVLALLAGSRRVERYFHWVFEEDMVSGEWFRFTPEMERVIALIRESLTKLPPVSQAENVAPDETAKIIREFGAEERI